MEYHYDILIIKVQGHTDNCYNVWANCDKYKSPSLLDFSVTLEEAEKIAKEFEKNLFDYQKVLYWTTVENDNTNDFRATDYVEMKKYFGKI